MSKKLFQREGSCIDHCPSKFNANQRPIESSGYYKEQTYLHINCFAERDKSASRERITQKQ